MASRYCSLLLCLHTHRKRSHWICKNVLTWNPECTKCSLCWQALAPLLIRKSNSTYFVMSVSKARKHHRMGSQAAADLPTCH